MQRLTEIRRTIEAVKRAGSSRLPTEKFKKLCMVLEYLTDENEEAVNLLDNKQDTLTSGVTIKTINSQPILGAGNLIISGGGGGDRNVDGGLAASLYMPKQYINGGSASG
jgi:hypothetical protein